MNSMSDLYTLQDPTKQYPQPKFKRQTQRVPGLDKKMVPKPDHGETSYRGSGRLPNRKALVTGGDSGIGRAAAIRPQAVLRDADEPEPEGKRWQRVRRRNRFLISGSRLGI